MLASGTRVEILKNLKERNYTVSELAQKLGHSKSTLHEHLERLMDANLIEKADNYTDKWVYYRLSRRGKELFADSGKRFVVIISSVFLAIGIMMIALSFFSASLFAPQYLSAARAPAPAGGQASDSVLKTYNVAVQSAPAAGKAADETTEGGTGTEAATITETSDIMAIGGQEGSQTPESQNQEAQAQEFPYLLAGGILFIVVAFIVGQKYRTSPEKMFLEKKKGKKWASEK